MSGTRNVARIPLQRSAGTAYGYRVPATQDSRGEQFARLIRDARLRKGISQDALAEATGINRSTVIRWEGGEAVRPEPDQVRAVCKYLGIDPRQAAIALGYLQPEDLVDAGAGDSQVIDPQILEVIEALEDPRLSAADKQAWVEYLRFLRSKSGPAGGRNAS